MRTLKTLVAFSALLLVASGANAAISFQVTALPANGDGDPAQEVEVNLTLNGGEGANGGILSFGIDWLLNGASVPLSAVQVPASSGTGPNTTCTNTNNQFMCAFGTAPNNATTLGSAGSNSTGFNWGWSFPSSPNWVLDGTYFLGRFTFTDVAAGNVSIGNCDIRDVNFELIPCSSNSVALNPIPEPTTAALIGLGLMGLVIGGGRRR